MYFEFALVFSPSVVLIFGAKTSKERIDNNAEPFWPSNYKWTSPELFALQNDNLVDHKNQSQGREDDEKDEKPDQSFVVVCETKWKEEEW